LIKPGIKPGPKTVGQPAPVHDKDVENARLFQRTLVVMAAIATALITWQLVSLLLLLFASILAAVMISDLTRALQRWARLPFAAALALAILLPLIVLAIVFGLFGSIMLEQFAILAKTLPDDWQDFTRWLRSSGPGRQALATAETYAPKMETVLGLAQSALANIGSAASALAIILVAGVYLAAQPGLYIDGILSLMAAPRAVHARHTLVSMQQALTAWLKAQAVGMAFVAVATSIGLTLIGLPSGLALGLVAGLCEFVPYLGVILVTLPAIVIGFGIDVQTGWLTVLVLVAVQQIQGNIVSPLAQRRMADLPPALTIFSLIGFGVLAGPMGVVLAVPLTVVAVALVKANRHVEE
jgi:predicted PurR-regulated permease PerM